MSTVHVVWHVLPAAIPSPHTQQRGAPPHAEKPLPQKNPSPRHPPTTMPTAGICLDCNALYTPPTNGTHALGRCPKCRANYIARKPRGQHRNTPTRQLTQRFYTSTAWRKARNATRARDGACTICGTTTNLTVHHIQPISKAPELALNLDNLTTLCRSCHGRHENAAKR